MDGIDYLIYADSAYTVTRNMATPFRNTVPGSMQALLNTRMARARTVASEGYYGIVSNHFQTIDFIRWQRAYLNNPAKQYLVAILFCNVIACLRGRNQVSVVFNQDDEQPSVRDYFSGTW